MNELTPLTCLKQCLTLNTVVSRHYILEKEHYIDLFSLLLVALKMQLKLSEIRFKLLPKLCYIIIISKSFLKFINCHILLYSVTLIAQWLLMILRQSKWFFAMFLISGRVSDGLSTLVTKLPRMIITLKAGEGIATQETKHSVHAEWGAWLESGTSSFTRMLRSLPKSVGSDDLDKEGRS